MQGKDVYFEYMIRLIFFPVLSIAGDIRFTKKLSRDISPSLLLLLCC